MSLTDSIIGKPLATSAEHTERIGIAAGIPIFGLDALTSAAYGPEAAMTLLIPLGVAGLNYIVPIITAILILLGIVFFSYLQTIAAYPNGGGSYTVASENLGTGPALLAAAALMIDYILTAAVGISAGVTAVTSAVPSLQRHSLLMCLVILAILAVVNLRGVKEAGAAFIVPALMFVGTLLAVIGVGVYHTILSGGHPIPVAAPPPALPATVKYLGIWLLLKAFSNGCAAMTGVEAVSNGVNAFEEPRAKKAQASLAVIIGILVVLLFGTTYLAKAYGITAMEPTAHHYQSMVSILTTAVFGRGWFYYMTMASILVALSLSANTAFAGFPRLARAIAAHEYLPHVFLLRGRRLLFSHGIYALTGFTAVILILSEGVTDWLIPLYAIGAFIAFTLSQAGMVVHWKKQEGGYRRHWWHMFVNGFGALATGITTLVVLVTKFTSGAWVTALLIPLLIGIMYAVKRHYTRVNREMADMTPLNLVNLQEPIVVIPMARWDHITEKAMRFGLLLSKQIKVVHIHTDDEDGGLDEVWETHVAGPIRGTGFTEPELKVISSHYRFVIHPLMDYILELEHENPGRKIAVLLPEMVVRHWWENLLHNQRVQLLKLLLLLKGNQRSNS
jgi:amino acid transporter